MIAQMRSFDGLLTTSDVAWMLGIAGSTVRKLVREGKLAHKTTFGGHYRFEPAVIEAFAADREKK